MEETPSNENLSEKSTNAISSSRKRIRCYNCKERYAQIGIITIYFAINNEEQIKQDTGYICGVCAVTTIEQVRFEKV